MTKTHHYQVQLEWTGNRGEGTSGYRAYDRDHILSAAGKPPIPGSSDPAFRGDRSRYNPEEMLVAALSSCHMLWFLHLCADSGVIVLEYNDQASGVMEETPDGGGRFREVTLKPQVVVSEAFMLDQLDALHERAHALCFIANSVNFPVHHEGMGRVKNSY
ncbi:MAG TPA: OsmC family protein [Saprospiraceae bacterium]|nr:OsmC family protein [Saprospiraceae bacterium]HMQ81649.1 OsmC family protein [Saprospiraceae bacterium]